MRVSTVAVKRRASTKGRTTKKRGGKPYRWFIALLLAVTCAFFACRLWNSDAVQMRFVYMWDYQQDIITYSQKNQVDPFLIAAIIKNESGFSHKAVSKVGAIGLMQIMPQTGRWIAEQMGLKDYKDEELYQARTNIRMGCWYIGELDHEFNRNLALVMIAYNAGRGQTKEWMSQYGWDTNFNDLKAIPFPDTREYVTRVLRDRDKYYLLYRDRLAIR